MVETIGPDEIGCWGTERKEESNMTQRDFPGGTVVKNPPTNAGDTGSIPCPGRSHMPRTN